MRSWAIAAGILIASLALVACGSSSSPDEPTATELPAEAEPTPPTSAPAEPELGGPPPVREEPSDPRADERAADVDELERVVRAWSDALNAGDDEAAADLFAPGAVVVQGGNAFELSGRAAAVGFNASLPCSGSIVDFTFIDEAILVTFELGDRPASQCDAPPGTLASAIFVVEDGLIELWQQVPVPPDATQPPDGAVT